MEELALALAASTGVLLRRDAVAHGIDDNALRRLVKGGMLVRIRQGAYALRAVWEPASERVRHRIASGAVMRQYADHVALSHSSAVLEHGGPTWGLDLSSVHLTHLTGGGRKGAQLVHHHGTCRVQDLTRIDGHWVTSPTRTVLDAASLANPEAAVVIASDFMHRGLTSMPELVEMEGTRQMWPYSLGGNVMLHLADPRFESVGESRSAYLIWSQGLPTPIPQWEIYLPDGRLLARVDFAWPERRLLCEFDGRIKYTALRRPNETIEEAVLREKRREEAILELTGWRIIRLTWEDLARPAVTAARIRRLLARAA
jgi:putative AbiEi antitoxin of type IV toxin-antitoxin system